MRDKKIIFDFVKGLMKVIALSVVLEIIYCILQKQESIFTYESLKLFIGTIILYISLKWRKYIKGKNRNYKDGDDKNA